MQMQLHVITNRNYVYYTFKSAPGTKYPFYGNFKNVQVPADWIKKSSALFNQRYWAAFNAALKRKDWVQYFVTQFNALFGSSVATPSDTVKSIQAYIESQIKDRNFVQNNGTVGRQFVDGVWGPVSATAWLQFSKSIVPSDTYADIMLKRMTTTSKQFTTPGVPIDSVIP